MARVVSLTVITTLIVILGITFFRVVAPFLLPLFLAGVVAMLCQPLYGRIAVRTKGHPRMAAGITTLAVLAMITLPLLVGTFVAAAQLYRLAMDAQTGGGWVHALERIEAKLEASPAWQRIAPMLPDLPAEGDLPRNAGAWARMLAERTLSFTGITWAGTLDLMSGLVSLFIGVLMFVIALYYFLADGPLLLTAAEQLIPVHVDYQRQLRQRFDQVVRAVMLSTFLAAIAQGLATAAALWVVGFHSFFLFAVVATLAAMIPLAGTWLVWAPCAVWLAIDGHWGSAIGLALFGTLVVGTMDNVIRTWILNSDARLHPLLAFISVLGGVQAMGLWGVFVGPIVASCLHALVQIFNVELSAYSKEAFGVKGAGGPAPAAPAAGSEGSGGGQDRSSLAATSNDGAPSPAHEGSVASTKPTGSDEV